MYRRRISFAGAGKVASALCKELFNAGFIIDTVVSENGSSAKELSSYCKAEWSVSLTFPASTEIIIVAVPDHVLKTVLEKIKCSNQTIIVHTAGSMGLDVFPPHVSKKGVFYPLQTFSPNRKIDFTSVPFLIETADTESSAILAEIAAALGGKSYPVDIEKRRIIHLSAVFVSNFTNHMMTLGKKITSDNDLPFDILAPLIKETFLKAVEAGPENSQTGPAVRHDKNIIEKHLELLSSSPELQKIYAEVTRSIEEYYNKPL